jgi:hypothetical protein
MSYTLRGFKQSPNYTPASQTKAFYGRPRTIEFGAGHWWDDPTRFPSFDGVVNTLMNAARQASAHAVVGDRVVQELVRAADTSWATGVANPFTVSIECDPQIIYMWRAGGDKAKAKRIFETLAEYIADKGWQNLTWFPHKKWMQTGCNPIEWGAVMTRAKQIYADKHKPAPTVSWKNISNPRKMIVLRDTYVYELPAVKQIGSVIKKGTKIDIKSMTTGGTWLRSAYSTDKGLNQGMKAVDIGEVPVIPPTPEWQKNLKSITPVKLAVLVAQTPIVDLNTLAVIKQLGQGTYVDFTKTTTVKGIEYLISSYSATNAIPNGIKRADVGVPAQPPVNEKPEWLRNWQDITDVKMYARADTDLVDLENGVTIKVIPRGTEVAVASTTEWHGQKYAITEYSTEKKLGQGIRIDDLDMKPVGGDKPTEPAPEQPTIDARISWLEKAVKAILAFLNIKV